MQGFLFICLPGLSLLASALFHWPCSISIDLSPRSVIAGVRPFLLAIQVCHCAGRSESGQVGHCVRLVSLLSPFVSGLFSLLVSVVPSCLRSCPSFLLVTVSVLSPFYLLLSPFLSPSCWSLCPSCLPLSPVLSPFLLVIVSVLSPFCLQSCLASWPFLFVILSVLSLFCFLLIPFSSPFLLAIVSVLSPFCFLLSPFLLMFNK